MIITKYIDHLKYVLKNDFNENYLLIILIRTNFY